MMIPFIRCFVSAGLSRLSPNNFLTHFHLSPTCMYSSSMVRLALIALLNAPLAAAFVSLSPHRHNAGNAGTAPATALSMAKVLYGSQGSRSPLCNWGAYELDVPITMGDLSKNPHPFGQIPCLVDEEEDATCFESGAILSYLYTHADTGDSQKRKAAILSWISWANASLDPICFLETPEGKVYDTGLKRPNKRVDKLNEILSKQDFLVDGGFSTADVAVAAYLLYVPQFFRGIDLSRWPNVVRYMKDCASRDAYGKAYGSQVQNYLVKSLEVMEGGEEKKKLFGVF